MSLGIDRVRCCRVSASPVCDSSRGSGRLEGEKVNTMDKCYRFREMNHTEDAKEEPEAGNSVRSLKLIDI